jgi:hypothetical protein
MLKTCLIHVTPGRFRHLTYGQQKAPQLVRVVGLGIGDRVSR